MANENNANAEKEYYTLTDENGDEYKFELIGSTELKGNVYYAFIEADSGDSEEVDYVILKSVINEDGSEDLVSIDDDDEFDTVADYFDDLFSVDIDLDDDGSGADKK